MSDLTISPNYGLNQELVAVRKTEASRLRATAPLADQLRCHDNGYETVVVDSEKRAFSGWQLGEITHERIREERAEYSEAPAIGFRTKYLPSFDIDVPSRPHANELRALVERLLAPTLVRAGETGYVLPYRLGEGQKPGKKVVVRGIDPELRSDPSLKESGRKHPKIEILWDGQYFVAIGPHPAGFPYVWLEPKPDEFNPLGGKSPLDVPREMLSSLTRADVYSTLRHLAELLEKQGYIDVTIGGRLLSKIADDEDLDPEHGYKERSERRQKAAGERPVPTREQITKMLDCHNPDADYDGWRNSLVGHLAICEEAGVEYEDAVAEEIAWSSQSDLFFKESTYSGLSGEEAIDQIHNTMPTVRGDGRETLGAGSFIRTARAGYNGRPGFDEGIGPRPGLHETVGGYFEGEPTEADARQDKDAAFKRLVESFRGGSPAEDALLPPLTFWDDEKTLPNVPGGSIGIAFAPTKAGKTFTILRIALDAMAKKGARVLNLCGEGSHGIKTQRVPALAKAMGLTLESLEGRYRTVDNVPLLTEQKHVAAVIEAHRDWRPNLIIVDTLTTALGGIDFNAPSAGALISGNSHLACLKKAFGATIILVGHTGKNEAAGLIGSMLFQANADFIWEMSYDAATQTVELFVDKMKDARDDFSIFFKLELKGPGDVVPVAYRLDSAVARSERNSPDAKYKQAVVNALQALATEGRLPIPISELAKRMAEPGPKGEPAEVYLARVETCRKSLEKKSRVNRGRAGPLFGFRAKDQWGEDMSPIHFELSPAYRTLGDDFGLDD